MWNLPKGEDFLPCDSVQELQELYEKENKAKPKLRLLCAIHRKEGKSIDDIAGFTNMKRRTVHETLRRFVARGIDGKDSIKQTGRSPTRGQLGNALKCVYAAPFVLSGEKGKVEVETLGQRYNIEIILDRIEQAPTLNISKKPTQDDHCTKVTVWWPDSTDSTGLVELLKTTNSYNTQRLVNSYAMFNPHATFRLKADPKNLLPEESSLDPDYNPDLINFL